MCHRIRAITALTLKRKTSLTMGFSHLLSRRVVVSTRTPLWFTSYHSGSGVHGHVLKTNIAQNQEIGPPEDVGTCSRKQSLLRMINAYREFGHLRSHVDPLQLSQPKMLVELNPKHYNLLDDSEEFELRGLLNIDKEKAKLSDVMEALEHIYCGTLSAEFLHTQTVEERKWFARRFEKIKAQAFSNEEKVKIAQLMAKAQAYDHFLANKFTTVKRYGGEGGESAMAFYQELFQLAALSGIDDIVLCIAHRGRLNLLTCLMEYPPVETFRKMKGLREFPPEVKGAGDVLSHLTNSVDLQFGEKSVHVTMVPNPSHLEAVNPVAMGKTRAKLQCSRTGDYSRAEYSPPSAMCVQIHGDAAFAGQGVVAECFALSGVPHFDVGGSVHLIHNNQVGFTTDPVRGRSSLYSSCTGKMTGVPVIRVNADHPEDVVRACRLAFEYRQRFQKDVIVDYVCFRRHGHNELDEPSFTQPTMYKAIRARNSIPDNYARQLVEGGVCTDSDIQGVVSAWNGVLSENLQQLDTYVLKARHLERRWAGLVQAGNEISTWDTGVPVDLLRFVGAQSVKVPGGFVVHPTLVKGHIERRLEKMRQGKDLDWAMAEALAIGSLLYQGFGVRISGQDVGRGTFSHRHAMFVHQDTDEIHIPLNHLLPEQDAHFEVCNSILSEEAVLGYEFGVSIENPHTLPIWEAQFGDFFNGAQIIIDTFVANAESKWLLPSGLVMLLPHGMDGAGPEHSSCKIERFLQLCDSKEDAVDGDDINMQIANPTTPAQYFHLLRRQMVRNYRKPLIVASPKTVLRLPAAVSTLTDMAPGTAFRPVIDDEAVQVKDVKKVVFVSGKHYYTLQAEKEARGVKDIAFVRLEQLCPFPADELKTVLGRYKQATEFVWAQEEHRNQGPWTFVAPRFENIVGKKLRYSGRVVLGQSAVGVGQVHRQETQQLITDIFG